MKRAIRFLTVFLTVCLLMTSLSSCFLAERLLRAIVCVTCETESSADPTIEQTNDPVEPVAEDLVYDLSDEDLTCFEDLLDALEKLILTDRSADEDAIDAVNGEMEDQYYHIVTQAQLAYIYYCMDESDAELSDAYLYASDMVSVALEKYQAVCLKIDESDAPGREYFFSDWTEEDLEEMRGFSTEMTDLQRANDELLVQYRSLTEAEYHDQTGVLYLQMVANRNRIAVLNEYDSYQEYAYQKVYDRDYTPEQAQAMYGYVAEYLVPLCEIASQRFSSAYSQLNFSDQRNISALFDDDYFPIKRLIDGYLATYPDDVRDGMSSLFEPQNQFTTTAKTAHEGAFTVFLYDPGRPVSYFGPGYRSGYTILHEMGHFYSAVRNGSDEIPMDHAETQSQGNEWIFTAYLMENIGRKNFADAVFYYELYVSIAGVIAECIIDAFESDIYRDPPTDARELDDRMTAVCEQFGGKDYLSRNVVDPDAYWRGVVLESPCYYISYAFSSMVSLSVFCEAMLDYSKGQDAYLTLMGVIPEGMTYTEWLDVLDIPSPFEEELYRRIADLARDEKIAA